MAGIRQRARALALQALYEADLSGHPASQAVDRLFAESRLSEAGGRLAGHLVAAVIEHRERIDRIIQDAAPLWPLSQVAPVDRNVLRLAVGELLFPPPEPAPLKAAINEVVDLAKQFGSEGSARFVNGVLGTVSGRMAELSPISERR